MKRRKFSFKRAFRKPFKRVLKRRVKRAFRKGGSKVIRITRGGIRL